MVATSLHRVTETDRHQPKSWQFYGMLQTLRSCQHVSLRLVNQSALLTARAFTLDSDRVDTDQVTAVLNSAVERNRGHVPRARLVREAVRPQVVNAP